MGTLYPTLLQQLLQQADPAQSAGRMVRTPPTHASDSWSVPLNSANLVQSFSTTQPVFNFSADLKTCRDCVSPKQVFFKWICKQSKLAFPPVNHSRRHIHARSPFIVPLKFPRHARAPCVHRRPQRRQRSPPQRPDPMRRWPLPRSPRR